MKANIISNAADLLRILTSFVKQMFQGIIFVTSRELLIIPITIYNATESLHSTLGLAVTSVTDFPIAGSVYLHGVNGLTFYSLLLLLLGHFSRVQPCATP